MFRITEDPSSGSVYSAWLKLQKWFYRVRWHGQGRCYGSILWSAHVRVTICCHNFSQELYKFPWWRILCDPKQVGALLNIL